MTTTTSETTRSLNADAIRTIHALQKENDRHIRALFDVECNDIEAADAIRLAIVKAGEVKLMLDKTMRNLLRGE